MLPVHAGHLHFGPKRPTAERIMNAIQDFTSFGDDPQKKITFMFERLKKNQDLWLQQLAEKYPDPGIMSKVMDYEHAGVKPMLKEKSYMFYPGSPHYWAVDRSSRSEYLLASPPASWWLQRDASGEYWKWLAPIGSINKIAAVRGPKKMFLYLRSLLHGGKWWADLPTSMEDMNRHREFYSKDGGLDISTSEYEISREMDFIHDVYSKGVLKSKKINSERNRSKVPNLKTKLMKSILQEVSEKIYTSTRQRNKKSHGQRSFFTNLSNNSFESDDQYTRFPTVQNFNGPLLSSRTTNFHSNRFMNKQIQNTDFQQWNIDKIKARTLISDDNISYPNIAVNNANYSIFNPFGTFTDSKNNAQQVQQPTNEMNQDLDHYNMAKMYIRRKLNDPEKRHYHTLRFDIKTSFRRGPLMSMLLMMQDPRYVPATTPIQTGYMHSNTPWLPYKANGPQRSGGVEEGKMSVGQQDFYLFRDAAFNRLRRRNVEDIVEETIGGASAKNNGSAQGAKAAKNDKENKSRLTQAMQAIESVMGGQLPGMKRNEPNAQDFMLLQSYRRERANESPAIPLAETRILKEITDGQEAKSQPQVPESPLDTTKNLNEASKGVVWQKKKIEQFVKDKVEDLKKNMGLLQPQSDYYGHFYPPINEPERDPGRLSRVDKGDTKVITNAVREVTAALGLERARAVTAAPTLMNKVEIVPNFPAQTLENAAKNAWTRFGSFENQMQKLVAPGNLMIQAQQEMADQMKDAIKENRENMSKISLNLSAQNTGHEQKDQASLNVPVPTQEEAEAEVEKQVKGGLGYDVDILQLDKIDKEELAKEEVNAKKAVQLFPGTSVKDAKLMQRLDSLILDPSHINRFHLKDELSEMGDLQKSRLANERRRKIAEIAKRHESERTQEKLERLLETEADVTDPDRPPQGALPFKIYPPMGPPTNDTKAWNRDWLRYWNRFGAKYGQSLFNRFWKRWEDVYPDTANVIRPHVSFTPPMEGMMTGLDTQAQFMARRQDSAMRRNRTLKQLKENFDFYGGYTDSDQWDDNIKDVL